MLNVSFKTEKLGAVSRNELPPSRSNVSLLSTQGKKEAEEPERETGENRRVEQTTDATGLCRESTVMQESIEV